METRIVASDGQDLTVLGDLQLHGVEGLAHRAEARAPEPNITRIERVNWWSMLRAGFEPISYERPSADGDSSSSTS